MTYVYCTHLDKIKLENQLKLSFLRKKIVLRGDTDPRGELATWGCIPPRDAALLFTITYTVLRASSDGAECVENLPEASL